MKRVFYFNFNQILTGFVDTEEAIFYENIKKPSPNPAQVFFLLYFGIDASYEHDFVTVVKP